MVVPVFITSCQVSEKLKIGPVNIQVIIVSKASKKVQNEPAALLTFCENFLNISAADIVVSIKLKVKS